MFRSKTPVGQPVTQTRANNTPECQPCKPGWNRSHPGPKSHPKRVEQTPKVSAKRDFHPLCNTNRRHMAPIPIPSICTRCIHDTDQVLTFSRALLTIEPW